MTDIRRFLMLGAATMAMGTLIAAGCGDSETTATTATSNGGNNTGGNNTGGNNTGGNNTGGSGTCTPADECEQCAATECMDEALACCMAVGCNELVRCVGENCQGAADQQACAIANCADEVGVAASNGSTTAAMDLGACLTPALENPTPGSACETCADMFGTGGNGGAGGN